MLWSKKKLVKGLVYSKMRRSDPLFMQKQRYLIVAMMCFGSLFSASANAGVTEKLQRIVGAVDLSAQPTEEAFLKMLETACENNSCSVDENKDLQRVGQKIVLCKTESLAAEGYNNKDISTMCASQQPMFACDSLPNALLRKMCYSGNNYSLQTWKDKESKMKSRTPASR